MSLLSRATVSSVQDGSKSVARTKDLPPGTIIGSYRLLELLGEGGMGHVYLAEHAKLGRKVALKVLRDELSSNPASVSRFFAEARAVNKISHAHIVEVTDFVEEPRSCLVMELLHGEDLGLRLLRQRLPISAVLDIGAQIASALAAVHAAGIVHRDLKPDNIYLVDRPGSPNFVKLLDFGVAKLMSMSIDSESNKILALHSTAIGQIIGTPAYMSPEQACGLRVDHRADVYALGVILYEMLVGRVPFEAEHFGDLIVQQMTVRPVRPSVHEGRICEIPPELDDLVMALLSKQVETRPQSMIEVEKHLRALQPRFGLPPPRNSGQFRSPNDSGPVRRQTPPLGEIAMAQTVDVGTPPHGVPVVTVDKTPVAGIALARAPTPADKPLAEGTQSLPAAVAARRAYQLRLRIELALLGLVAAGALGYFIGRFG